MKAVHFFTTQPKELKIKFPKPPKSKLKESFTLNYQLVNFITQDVIQSVKQLQDDGVVPKKKLYNKLEELSDEDSNYMYEVYCKAGRKSEYIKDYAYVTEYFKKLSEKLFSEYQLKTDDKISELMYAILCYQFILNTAPSIAIANNQTPNFKILNLIKNEMDSLKLVFSKRFSKVSNQKFYFETYKNLFNKIKNSTHEEFTQLTNNI